MRAEPLEERRKRLSKLLSRKTKAVRDGIQISETITGDGAASFVMPAVWTSKASCRSTSAPGRSGRTRAWLKTKNPNFERRWFSMLSNAELDRLFERVRCLI